ncbi:MAG TPA: gamma-glutamylcyclotransferase family protein [Gemmataceae bacterium]|nr:gamma-glutamylcyclotransferase family protein [Gemmataceae bacterium]
MTSPRLCLFVYGSLRHASGHPLAAFLAGRARLLGAGSVAGRLYDLGPYPGMTDPLATGDRVRGDVYELDAPEAILAVLDDYEGCGPASPQPHLYERVVLPAMLGNGDTRAVWVYAYRGSLEQGRHVPSGEYLPTL